MNTCRRLRLQDSITAWCQASLTTPAIPLAFKYGTGRVLADDFDR